MILQMTIKKFKYQELLSQYPNCPPDNYVEIEKEAFRWVHKDENRDSFLPMNLQNEPPSRIIDDNDLMCKAFGLSLFDSFKNALLKFQKLYNNNREHQRPDFVFDRGENIAMLQLVKSCGVANEPNKSNYGHFTFHEYENTNLRERVCNIFNMFDADGNFVN
jgi:hypothetical protein